MQLAGVRVQSLAAADQASDHVDEARRFEPIAAIAGARSLDDVVARLRDSARAMIGADGICVVLRDGDQCRFVAEDAQGPLWLGRSVPLSDCVSGIAMRDKQAFVIADVTADPRVPAETYTDTFVRSMAVAPIGHDAPVATLGAYWARIGAPSETQVSVLRALADVAAAALDNVRIVEAAESSQAQLRAVLDSVSDCYYALDREWKFVEFNRASEIYFKLNRDDVIGRELWDLFPSGRGQAYEDACRAAMDRGERARLEAPSAFRRGNTVEMRTAPMKDGISVVLTDITERRRAEAELRKQAEALTELNRTLEQRVAAAIEEREAAMGQLHEAQKTEALGQMAGGVAHDFNNLLMPILGGLELVRRRGGIDSRSVGLIDGAIQAAERARTLVQRMLAFARRQPLQPRAIDVPALVADLKDLIATSVGSRVRIVVDSAGDVPSARADANQLELALINIALNARDAMPDGGTLTIETAAFSGAPMGARAGDYVRLAVTDTGEGMDAATLKRAVEPFFSTKGVGKGTGLGLSMAHGLAAQLGGALELSSVSGAGTTVTLFLPVAKPEAKEAPAPSAPAAHLSAGVVLLVDDEDIVRESTKAMLEDLGYAVVEARSAQEALKQIETGLAFEWLVTDHLMPGMTGADLARAVRQRRSDVRVLVVSGYSDVEDIAPDLPRLSKPFGMDDLAQRLAAIA